MILDPPQTKIGFIMSCILSALNADVITLNYWVYQLSMQ